jgi:hypothetical protein
MSKGGMRILRMIHGRDARATEYGKTIPAAASDSLLVVVAETFDRVSQT